MPHPEDLYDLAFQPHGLGPPVETLQRPRILYNQNYVGDAKEKLGLGRKGGHLGIFLSLIF